MLYGVCGWFNFSHAWERQEMPRNSHANVMAVWVLGGGWGLGKPGLVVPRPVTYEKSPCGARSGSPSDPHDRDNRRHRLRRGGTSRPSTRKSDNGYWRMEQF